MVADIDIADQVYAVVSPASTEEFQLDVTLRPRLTVEGVDQRIDFLRRDHVPDLAFDIGKP